MDYAEQWRAVQVYRASTAEQVERNLRLHVYPRLGHQQLRLVRPSDVRALIKLLTGIRRPEVHHRQVHPLPVETVEDLIGSVPPRYRGLLVLGAGTGVSISEALGLTSDRINWIERRVTIDRQLVAVGPRGAPVFGPLKDRRNRPRLIPAPQIVIDELSAHVARFGLGEEGLIFTGTRGGPIRRTSFADTWRSVAGPLGVPPGDGYHQLRHFYASVLIRAGESVKVVQERLGHTLAEMTLGTNGHLWPGDDERTRAAVDKVLRGLSGAAEGDASG